MSGDAFLAEQFDLHHERLRAVAQRMLGSRREAEEALRTARAAGLAEIDSWLATVVARVCVERLRARARAQPRPPSHPHETALGHRTASAPGHASAPRHAFPPGHAGAPRPAFPPGHAGAPRPGFPPGHASAPRPAFTPSHTFPPGHPPTPGPTPGPTLGPAHTLGPVPTTAPTPETAHPHAAALADGTQLALFVVLGSLGPDERLALVLHDLFALPLPEVARLTGRTTADAARLVQRARRRVRGGAAENHLRPGRGLP
ncbi:sigma factor-like helix-turn-helix DNA-binding protein [Streptomyces sp. NPDC090127]|uniref:sigma factor-like helix-turn-helix DNA-binding protein n=1 Tax=Streptomyces sp. NPDC090127 TaxID=3365953 RepID=UPI003818D6A9